MSEIWNSLLIRPLLNSLLFLYQTVGNLGIAIILLTLALRFLLTPLILPSLKLSKKMQELSPELAKLKEKFKNDKQGLIAAQAELYRTNGVNPAAGCLPQIAQLLVLIALFSVFNSILRPQVTNIDKELNPNLYSFNKLPENFEIKMSFLNLNMNQPDTICRDKSTNKLAQCPAICSNTDTPETVQCKENAANFSSPVPGLPVPLPGIFLILSALSQLASSLMMSTSIKTEKKIASKTETSTDDTMVEVQKQMTYIFPLMTLVIGYQFPSGLVLYWLIFSFYSAVQQYMLSGWGGLRPWLVKFNLLKSPSHG